MIPPDNDATPRLGGVGSKHSNKTPHSNGGGEMGNQRPRRGALVRRDGTGRQSVRARTYGSRPTRRSRRSAAEVEAIRAAMLEALEADHPMTVRQVFYRMVTEGIVPKTESAYKSTVVRLLGDMRRERAFPCGWIADNTRWMRKPDTYSGLQNLLNDAAATYRRSIWDTQDVYVEVWLEKDALSGVLFEETAEWDVPLMVTRGYPSVSFLSQAAAAIEDAGKPAFLYYLGDHDPSGVDIPRAVEKGLREWAPDADITFRRVAVNPDQIASLNLQTRPTKTTDSRSKDFEGESVEVDAIPSATLRQIVRGCIEQHIDGAALAATRRVERLERESLQLVQLPELWDKRMARAHWASLRRGADKAAWDAAVRRVGKPEREFTVSDWRDVAFAADDDRGGA